MTGPKTGGRSAYCEYPIHRVRHAVLVFFVCSITLTFTLLPHRALRGHPVLPFLIPLPYPVQILHLYQFPHHRLIRPLCPIFLPALILLQCRTLRLHPIQLQSLAYPLQILTPLRYPLSPRTRHLGSRFPAILFYKRGCQ
jgi:hypothetical protein